jgi:DNA polymerase V
MTNAATQAVERIFREGYRCYSKAEVLLLDLRQPGEYTDNLFALTQPKKCAQLMKTLDTINARWGRGTLRSATVPIEPDWGMRRELMSQSYTTRIDQLWSVKAL